MLYIEDKKNCCGCSACVQRCPKQCISLTEDKEGFLYPNVDETQCANCGLCEKVCPIQNRVEKILPQEVLAVKNPNEEERMASSSGGVFLPLAREIINRGGVVFGAVVYAEKMEDVYTMMGSKYVQSRIENTYKKTEQFLKQGREVMFVGSPCQITGLRTFLRNKEYPNLLAVDFICHGVPSPGVWRRYLAETYSGFKEKNPCRRQATAGKNTVLFSSLNAKSPIWDIKFRDKVESGWKKYRFVVHRKSASKADKNSVLSSDIHYNNPYMKGFLTNVYLRPSCYDCKCKNGVSHSDLTLADFWGIETVNASFDDDKGVGLVLVNSALGASYLQLLDVDSWKSDISVAKKNNPGFGETILFPPLRKTFFELLNEGCSVELSLRNMFTPSFRHRCYMKIKKILKVMFSKVK